MKGDVEQETFDFIVVGAGSAGCVMANRLSAGGKFRVLLIEEGPKDSSPMLKMPKGFGQVLGRSHYVSRHPVERPEGEPEEVWLRGKALGGSSSVNGMTWIRCQTEDFDALAAAGNKGWSWSEMEPYFDELDGGGDNSGIIKVNRHSRTYPIADAFVDAGKALNLPVKSDLNAGDQRGIGYLHSNIDRRGNRFSAASGFLKPALKRPNLRVETGVRIDQLQLQGKRVTGIIGQSRGREVRYAAAREVILCAGALSSPLILQRSGVGPAELLQEHGITVVHDLPGVGKNMREHILLALNFEVSSWKDSENRQYNGWRLFANVLDYFLRRQGPMSQSPFHAAAFTATSDAVARPNVQLMLGPFTRKGQVFDDFPGINIFGYQLRPESVGEIQITSQEPEAKPLIRPNYLSRETDQHEVVAMVRIIRRLAAQQPLAARIVAEVAPTAGAESDQEILDVFRQNCRPGFHTTGTCSMGQGPAAVVDERTRVHGLAGVRVVDCSIYPQMLSGNLNAPTMAVAMRAADMILEDQRRAEEGSSIDTRRHNDAEARPVNF